jgi:purine-binding chemotaxis protein CheW
MDSIHWNEAGQLEVLAFELAGETFAVEAAGVQEILDLLPETVVPGASPLVASVINFRGRIIPLADLRLAFGMARTEANRDSRIVVIAVDHGGEEVLVGLKADRVHEVTTLERDSSEEPPVVGMRWRRELVRGLVRREAGLVVLPDIHAVFATMSSGSAPPAASAPPIH